MCVGGGERGGLSPAMQSWEEASKSKLANNQSAVEGVAVPYDSGDSAHGGGRKGNEHRAMNCLIVGLTKPCTWLA